MAQGGASVEYVLSLVASFFLAMLFIAIIRFAACRKKFSPTNPIASVFSFDFSTKCDKIVGILAMFVCCLCSAFVLWHLTQFYSPTLSDPYSLSPTGARY